MTEHDLGETHALEKAEIDTEAVDHCGSCHSDAWDGYPMNWVTFPDGTDAEVCCGASEAINKKYAD